MPVCRCRLRPFAHRPVASQHLDNRLERLKQLRVVKRWQPARTGEDFLRRRVRHQLTPAAASLHTFWSALAEAEDAASDLTLASRAVHDRLTGFADALRPGQYASEATEFQVVTTLHQAMAKSARSWQRNPRTCVCRVARIR